MVTLGGAGPIEDYGRDAFQELDQVSIFKTISKAVMRPTDPARYPEHISTAFRIATEGRPGPVYVDCAEDVLYGEVEEEKVGTPSRAAQRSRSGADADGVGQAVDMLAAAKRPVLVAGGGAHWSEAGPDLQTFIEATGIPIFTTPMSRGLVPEDHSLSLLAARSTALREADVVLVVGTRMNWIYTFGRRLGPEAKFIQIDIHAEEIGHNRDVDLGLVGDARTVVRQLIDAVSGDSRFSGEEDSEWVAYLREQNAIREERAQELLNSSQVPIHPLRLCKEVRDVIDRDAIVTIDGNEILHYGRQSIPVYYPGHRLNSGPSGCMGVGLPYAIGAKVAKPDVQVVAVHGDGSLGMNLMDFDTAVRHDIPIVVVVSNNEGWTARVEGVRKPGRELGYTRFDRLAEALGGHGENVEEPDEIRPALERAFASGKPAIVNVRTDPTARALSRFVGSRME
ncbi:MAG: thiamine pyrophosphate-binding protein [Chloroflexi bacterium]|nr:thiamine pyrophosphate-binding protein [Chloroflexota bacterium]